MSNTRLVALSKIAGLADERDLPFFIGDVVLMRSQATVWAPVVYMGYDPEPIGDDIFRSGECYHSMIAPAHWNDKVIGSMNKALGQIDYAWMKEKGLIGDE